MRINWITIIILSLLLITVYSMAAEQEVTMKIDGMTCSL
jgi:hypothetical protein